MRRGYLLIIGKFIELPCHIKALRTGAYNCALYNPPTLPKIYRKKGEVERK
jgi:hypothetical protein